MEGVRRWRSKPSGDGIEIGLEAKMRCVVCGESEIGGLRRTRIRRREGEEKRRSRGRRELETSWWKGEEEKGGVEWGEECY